VKENGRENAKGRRPLEPRQGGFLEKAPCTPKTLNGRKRCFRQDNDRIAANNEDQKAFFCTWQKKAFYH